MALWSCSHKQALETDLSLGCGFQQRMCGCAPLWLAQGRAPCALLWRGTDACMAAEVHMRLREFCFQRHLLLLLLMSASTCGSTLPAAHAHWLPGHCKV